MIRNCVRIIEAPNTEESTMITQFHVQNYKALKDVTLDLTPIHVLIGPNDSGKTSLIEALAALCRSVDYPMSQAFVGRWEGADLVIARDVERIVSLGVHEKNTNTGVDVDYEIGVRFSQSGREPLLIDEKIRHGLQSWSLGDQFKNRISSTCTQQINRRVDGARQLLTPNVVDSDRQSIQSVHDAISGVQIYRWNARLLSLPCALDENSRFAMQASGFGLARVLDAILGYDIPQFQKLESRFKQLFPSILSLRILPAGGFRTQPSEDEFVPLLTRETGKGIFVRFQGHDADVPATHLSEGILLMLAYLAILYSPEPPRLLLIEEPENGIHPKRLQEVLLILKQLVREQQHTQIILTTHSPYVLDSFLPEEVTLCRKGDSGEVSVHRLSESKAVREQIDIFSLGEIWTAAGDDALATAFDSVAMVKEDAP
jgi:ABC-type branched-subunit amino acid transport system ATPase component